MIFLKSVCEVAVMSNKRTKKPCKYCGGLTNGDVCGHCVKKLELWRIIQTMVRNKVKVLKESEVQGE